jgi:hypothetical protein
MSSDNSLQAIGAWFRARPWAITIGGLLVIGILYTQGGPWGALGTLGLIMLGLILLVWIGRQMGGS